MENMEKLETFRVLFLYKFFSVEVLSLCSVNYIL